MGHTKAETAADVAEAIANDDSHGYDQANRWGPDLDCSSLVILSYERAGVPVKSSGATYTGNMRSVFLSCGFRDVSGEVNLASGAGMLRGDVLLNERSHTALFAGGGRIIHARGNEMGDAVGGQTGDQTDREICVQGYFNFPWDCVLRYEEEESGGTPETYTVKAGDMLGLIAARFGTTIKELVRLNDLPDANRIWVGQVLKLRETDNGGTPGAASPTDNAEEESDIAALAKAVIRGEYGNGLVRRLRLGKKYDAVQAEVNRMLAG